MAQIFVLCCHLCQILAAVKFGNFFHIVANFCHFVRGDWLNTLCYKAILLLIFVLLCLWNQRLVEAPFTQLTELFESSTCHWYATGFEPTTLGSGPYH